MIVPSTRLLWLVTVLGLPLAVAAIFTPAAYAAAGVVLAVIVADGFFSHGLLASVKVEVASPLRAYKDRLGQLALECAAAKPIARLRLGIAWPESFTFAREEQRISMLANRVYVEWPFTPRRRGDYSIAEICLECPSFWGFWEIRRAAPLTALIRVFPTLETLNDLLAFRREAAGSHAQRQIGKGREFEKLREYLPGDGFDEIHWKATARRAKPITKVFQVERTREIYLVIDGSRLTGRAAAAGTRLDRYIGCSLVLAAAAERNGDRFGLVTFQDRVLDFVRAGKGASHRAHCRQALSRLNERPLTPDFNEVATELRIQLRGRALLLFLTDLDDPAASEGFTVAARFLSRKHLVAAATIRPPGAKPLFSAETGSIDAIYEQLGGFLGWRSLKELEVRLRQQGVRFGVFDENSLSRQVADLYGEIKMRQLI